MGRTPDRNLPCAPALKRERDAGNIPGTQPTGEEVPLSPQAASLLSEVAGLRPLEACLLAASRPPSTPLSKASMQKGAIWSFVDTFSSVQYLPGVNEGPGSPVSAVCPLPHDAPSLIVSPEHSRLWGQAHRVGEPCRVRVSEAIFSNTQPHALTQKLLKSNVSKSDPLV